MSETQLENPALEWFAEMGWQVEIGPEIASCIDSPMNSNYKDVLLDEPLKRAILRINPGLPGAAMDKVIHKLKTVDYPVLVHRNRCFHRYLTYGIKVEVNEEDQKTKLILLI